MYYLDFLKEALVEASDLANKFFGKVNSISIKDGDNNQVLTEADLAIGELLVKKVQKDFPEYNVIDEEAGVIDKGPKYTWVIDPVDGTSNFAAGVIHYGVYLGLLEGDKPIAGGMAIPGADEIYIAQEGIGCFLNDQKIKMENGKDSLDYLVAYEIDGRQDDPEYTRNEAKLMAEIILNIRNLRASNSAYDLALLLKGSYGAILNRTSKIWDNVAAQILVQEAGGIYSGFTGQELDYSPPLSKANQNYEYFAGTTKVHEQLIEVIKKHG